MMHIISRKYLYYDGKRQTFYLKVVYCQQKKLKSSLYKNQTTVDTGTEKG
jgi:hypothetical protein